ncbi:DNA-directed RNA polymerases I and III subunit RPAC2 isoform X2 [Daktulosphaira vitifoliae]|uniref:DNA-directed RNA polymerases I and III subunit RPAC2 isoform X2 n=1 Tax=Daktulosphaira vitifoliae TaxID=58002 RepID=UPI0021AA222B|nr:DNA-directed RNA polymerases I and III subunit RPAC2 isoform X2 [Daktulosphaira vitifoliae]
MSDLEDDVKKEQSELDRTFVFEDEGHTLGSLLTYVLESFPETEFCAYSIRHPSENKIYLRLKVRPGNSVEEVFKKGIHELNKMMNHVKKTFKALVTYENSIKTK